MCAEDIVRYRNIGDMIAVNNQPKITTEEMSLLIKQLLHKYPHGYEAYIKRRELDFSFYSASNTPYRVNAYFKSGNMAVAMRKIAYKPFALEYLMYEDVADTIKDKVLNKKT
ncbi:MAG: hypothetical protein Q8O99_02455 [bacterium]|nr:hypothetical protein [bacterium]